MSKKNSKVIANRLFKLLEYDIEFTAKTAVGLLVEDGFSWAPHVNAMAQILKWDDRFELVSKSKKHKIYVKSRLEESHKTTAVYISRGTKV